jgi:hypothetical protein
MTVYRYRDVSAMPSLPHTAPGPARHARIRDLWEFSAQIAGPLYRPGVYRFRSIEDSFADRERATIERMRAMRAARR